jgi:hypothetical protein
MPNEGETKKDEKPKANFLVDRDIQTTNKENFEKKQFVIPPNSLSDKQLQRTEFADNSIKIEEQLTEKKVIKK